MNDKANIRIWDGESSVCLYTPQNGSELPRILGLALHCGIANWSKPGILARNIFGLMLEDEAIDSDHLEIISAIRDGKDKILEVYPCNSYGAVSIEECWIEMRDHLYPFEGFISLCPEWPTE